MNVKTRKHTWTGADMTTAECKKTGGCTPLKAGEDNAKLE